MAKSKITDKQNECLLTLSRIGCIPLGMEKDLGLRASTCKSLCEFGYFEKKTILNQENKCVDMYVPTKKSQTYFKNHFDSSYKATKSLHDYTLAQEYSKLSTNEREHFMTEYQTKSYFEDCLYNRYQGEDKEELIERYETQGITTPDCMYISDSGSLECIEVITINYKGAAIIEKQLASTIMGANFNDVRC